MLYRPAIFRHVLALSLLLCNAVLYNIQFSSVSNCRLVAVAGPDLRSGQQRQGASGRGARGTYENAGRGRAPRGRPAHLRQQTGTLRATLNIARRHSNVETLSHPRLLWAARRSLDLELTESKTRKVKWYCFC